MKTQDTGRKEERNVQWFVNVVIKQSSLRFKKTDHADREVKESFLSHATPNYRYRTSAMMNSTCAIRRIYGEGTPTTGRNE